MLFLWCPVKAAERTMYTPLVIFSCSPSFSLSLPFEWREGASWGNALTLSLSSSCYLFVSPSFVLLPVCESVSVIIDSVIHPRSRGRPISSAIVQTNDIIVRDKTRDSSSLLTISFHLKCSVAFDNNPNAAWTSPKNGASCSWSLHVFQISACDCETEFDLLNHVG